VNPAPIVQLKVIDGEGEDETPSGTPRDEKKKLRRDSGPKGMMYMQSEQLFSRMIDVRAEIQTPITFCLRVWSERTRRLMSYTSSKMGRQGFCRERRCRACTT